MIIKHKTVGNQKCWLPKLTQSILEREFDDCIVNKKTKRMNEHYIDTVYSITKNSNLICKFIMDENNNIIKTICVTHDSDYQKLTEKIRRNYMHHEITTKFRNFWKNADYDNPLKEYERTHRTIFVEQKKENKLNHNYNYIIVNERTNTFYLLIKSNFISINLNKEEIPKEVLDFLRNNLNCLSAFKTVEVYNFFRNNNIYDIHCYYDIDALLTLNGFKFKRLKDVFDAAKLENKNYKEQLKTLRKYHEQFLALPKSNEEKLKNFYENEFLPYLSILNKSICNPIMIDDKLFRKTYESCNEYEKSEIDKYFDSDKEYIIHSYSISKTLRTMTKNKNLQGLPIKTKEHIKKIAYSMIPKNNNIFLALDIKSADVLSMAIITKDENLLNMFKKKQDVYTEIAKKLLDKVVIDSKEREFFKSFFLQFCYGQSIYAHINPIKQCFSITNDKIALKTSQTFYNKLRRMFPELYKYKPNVLTLNNDDDSQNKFVEGINGNLMCIDNLHTQSMNNICQCCTSNIIISLTNEILRKSKNLDVKLVFNRHDELIFEVNKKNIERFKIIVAECSKIKLDNCMTGDYISINYSLKIGKNYGEVLSNE